MKGKINLIGKNIDEIDKLIFPSTKKIFHSKIIFKWINQKGISDFDEISDIPKTLRKTLKENFSLEYPEVEKISVSSDGSKKYLLKLKDGLKIECVFLPEPNRNTFCISTQVGCKIGCDFCLTGKMGFKRDLNVDEIISQILILLREVDRKEKRINIVFMGMGEPLDNLENLKKSLDLITNAEGISISPRRITVSTSGLIHGIDEILKLRKSPKIAISLNTFDEKIRSKIMPINKKYSINDLINFIQRVQLKKRNKITIEWVLMKEINDTEKDVIEIKKYLKYLPVKINLIPFNPSTAINYEPVSEGRSRWFAEELEKAGISVTLRKKRGEDIRAACGQLAVFD
ncbi:MAG: 23S rRNA (adenine(2503)-C(2))-methyltransferase RlmN [Acidobacteriota bacterium]